METQKAVLISGSEYLELQSPEFVGQTKPDVEGIECIGDRTGIFIIQPINWKLKQLK